MPMKCKKLQGKRLPDASEKMNEIITDDLMKKMPCGEMVDINAKNLAPKTEQWVTPLFAAYNKSMGYSGEWALRRFAVGQFSKSVPENERDTTLSKKIKKEVPFMLPYIIDKYHQMLKKAGEKSFWDVCCEYYREQREENAITQMPLVEFLNTPRNDKGYWVENVEDNTVQWDDFVKAFQGWMKGVHKVTNATLNQVSDASTIKSAGYPFIRHLYCSKCKNRFSKNCCSNKDRKKRKGKPVIYNMVIHVPSFGGGGGRVVRDSPYLRDPLDDGLNEVEEE